MNQSTRPRAKSPHNKILDYAIIFGTCALLASCSDGDNSNENIPNTDNNEPAVATDGSNGVKPDMCHLLPPGNLPEVALPNVALGDEYILEPARWGIQTDGSDAQRTTDGFNEALDWASQQGISKFLVPAGTYLIGVKTSDIYSGDIKIPSNMVFEMDPGAILQMATNDTWNYCVLAVRRAQDVIIRGGTIIGDRETHVYAGGGGHDEGHAICIEGNSERVLVENMTLQKVTGDGILIVGSGDEGASCFDITIRSNDIHHNRRQGVSIVGGVRILIENNDIHHIQGTAPQFGIDIESLKFRSADILIQQNRFNQNAGGDYVNTDGTNVWFLDNECDQTGLTERQSDGPIVHWGKTDQVVRGNTITVTVGSSNGMWGLIGYSNAEGSRGGNTQPNYFEDNTFIGGGLHLAKTENFVVQGNIFQEGSILGAGINCVRFNDNEVNGEVREHYKFKNVAGTASGNLSNGEPVEFLMADDSLYTNSPPHLW